MYIYIYIYILFIVYFLRIPLSPLKHLLFPSFSTFMTCPLFLFYCNLIIVEATLLGMTKYLFNLIYSTPTLCGFPDSKEEMGYHLSNTSLSFVSILFKSNQNMKIILIRLQHLLKKYLMNKFF